MADRILTTQKLLKELNNYNFKQLHIHHTWKPTHKDFDGKNHLALQQGMRNFHINTRGWKDIGHHLALMPDGLWVTGRPFNQTPASIKDWNKGALAVEMVGNFDKLGTGSANMSGYDILAGKQKESILALIKYYGQRFDYDGVKFHREGPGVTKTCPGTSLNKAVMIGEAKGFNENMDNDFGNGGKGMALRRGDKGSEVTRLQQDLIALGYGKIMEPHGADGSYGPATEAAVKTFQRDHKLEIDGIAGPETQGKIRVLLGGQVGSTVEYKKMYEEIKEKLEKIRKIID
ncbi:MAG: peptidoglycan-binding domain-containing protein [Clostridiales bacterium]|nr:peptidoglycan-binding domain-containing protein [Clostridiales bacterium]